MASQTFLNLLNAGGEKKKKKDTTTKTAMGVSKYEWVFFQVTFLLKINLF